MSTRHDLLEARMMAEAIIQLSKEQVSALYYQQAMRRSLSRTVRQLDKLVEAGGDDRKLGSSALKRMGFEPDF